MKTTKIKCPEDLLTELERTHYEVESLGAVVDRYLDRHSNEPDALDSPIFVRYMKEFTEKNAYYSMLKTKLENEVVKKEISDPSFNWSLDFQSGDISVDILS